MLFCSDCANEREWPDDAVVRSFGICELCNTVSHCNDVEVEFLPSEGA